ncbi:MAG: hypothetical protein ACRDN0_36960 [Trebonia sp.]
MTAPVSKPATRYGGFGRLWWLPSGGIGNGLDDESWVPILEISGRIVTEVLAALCRAGAPAYAAPARPAARRLRDRSGRPPGYQLWVGGSAYGEAESALIALMPSLAARDATRGGGDGKDAEQADRA